MTRRGWPGELEKCFTDLATNQSEHVKWFREQVLAIYGVDLAQPPDGPEPEIVLDWKK